MTDHDQEPKAIARVKNVQRFRSRGRISSEEKSISRYTFFMLGAVSLVAGGWAITCLLRALSSDGPLNLVKHLLTALIGK